jgi:hypothetical protein
MLTGVTAEGCYDSLKALDYYFLVLRHAHLVVKYSSIKKMPRSEQIERAGTFAPAQV